ncbi:HlyD family secretion protein [Rosistilla carotiformis]|uniref:HlyD family secretion protein n=1 Tax=Rosistilla carotiformis TaxID=2528017 RepID=A0A518JP02_9BACT|nr:HlyD family efflux transporter periplasmic adaptor subunit [Rosistilla carotiformis]QDV67274.1 HlyD family secretion protein [Rosistilla carotiformis]
MQPMNPAENLLPHPHVERFFAQVDRVCSQPDVSSTLFFELIEVLVEEGIATAAALWCRELEELSLLARSPNGQSELPHPLPEVLQQVAAGTSASFPCAIPDASKSATAGTRIVANYCGGPESFLVVDAAVEPDASPAVIRQRQEILEGFAEIVGNRWVRHRFETLSQRPTATDPSQAFLDLIVDASSSDEALRSLAAVLLDATSADRVSLLQYQAGASRLLAMAPAGNIDHRALVVRRMAGLVTKLAQGSGTLSYAMGMPCPFAEDETLVQFVDESECRQVDVQLDLPRLQSHPTAIVLERFTVDRTTTPRDRGIASQALPVLRHLVDRQERGWRKFLRPVRHASPARSMAVGAMVCCVALMGLLWIPGDLWISVDGQLHPVASRGLFAPSDGVIDAMYVAHGAAVTEGARLLSIRDPELELRASELEGQIATLQSQLASAQAARSQGARDAERRRGGELSAQEQDLEIQLVGLQRQRDVLLDHRKQLDITSPLSGTVQRWDLQQELRDRPVTHGQHLMDVIDANSAWELRLDVPDGLIGYVIRARHGDPLDVRFRIRSEPGQVMSAVVQEIAESSQIDPQGRTTVLVTAAIDDGVLHDPRIGAGVVARIDCGRRSLAFIWFRELIEFCQSHFYF